MAEEEGFDFPQYGGVTRWQALVCYGWNIETKEFTICRVNIGSIRALIQRVSRHGQ
jgi:hypothetical protein